MAGRLARGLRFAVLNVEEVTGTAFFLVMVVSVSVGVVFRYGFNRPLIWPEEVSSFSFLWAMFLGAAAAAKRHEHIVVDTVVTLLPRRLRWAAEACTAALVALILATVAILGYQFAWGQRGTTTEALEMPVVLWALAVPVSCTLACRYAVRDLLRKLSP